MNREEAIYYEIYFELIDNNDLIGLCDNPIKNYLELLSNAPILEIGIGVGIETLYLAHLGKKVVCIEKEESIIEQLKNRMAIYQKVTGNELNIVILKQDFPNINLPYSEYSCVILSNILHFFEYETVKTSIEKMKNYVATKGYLYIKAHSVDHSFNKSPQEYFL